MFERLKTLLFGTPANKKEPEKTALIKLKFTISYYDEILERRSREEYHSGEFSVELPIPKGLQVRDVMVRVIDDIEFQLRKFEEQEEEYDVKQE